MLIEHHQLHFIVAICITVICNGIPVKEESRAIVHYAPGVDGVSSMTYIDQLNISLLARQHIQTENNTHHIYIAPLALFAVNQTKFVRNSTTNRTTMIIPLILYTDEQIKFVRENNINTCKQGTTECIFHKISMEAMHLSNKHVPDDQPNLLDCYHRYIKNIWISYHHRLNQGLLYVIIDCISNQICLKFEEALHQSKSPTGLYLEYTIQQIEQHQMIISDKHLLQTNIHLSELILESDVEQFLQELLHAANIRDNDKYILSQIDLLALRQTLRKTLLGKKLFLMDENNEKQWNSIYWKKVDTMRPDRVLKLLSQSIKSRHLSKHQTESNISGYDEMDNYVRRIYDTKGYNLYLKYRHLFELQHKNGTQRESTLSLKLKPILAYSLNKFNRSTFLVHQPVHMTKRDNMYSIPIRSILSFKETQSILNRTNTDLHKLEDLQRIIADLQKKLADRAKTKQQLPTTIGTPESMTTETPAYSGELMDYSSVFESTTSSSGFNIISSTSIEYADITVDSSIYELTTSTEQQVISTIDSTVETTETITEHEVTSIFTPTIITDSKTISFFGYTRLGV
ncbi:unnamed protein product [Adineta steineri]|uniref:Uncharacterized protein n=1 Tax=Adineta steineri TaxID=433720 RepID=A0A813TCJ2_9BILA|nr:unnamed protein product [Adineta steineri]